MPTFKSRLSWFIPLRFATVYIEEPALLVHVSWWMFANRVFRCRRTTVQLT